MFIVGGFNAYPAEIENALLPPSRHPRRPRSSASPTSGSARSGMAFVVAALGSRRRPATTSSPGAATQMANYKVPRVVEIVDALPLNATGKVVKDELRARVSR